MCRRSFDQKVKAKEFGKHARPFAASANLGRGGLFIVPVTSPTICQFGESACMQQEQESHWGPIRAYLTWTCCRWFLPLATPPLPNPLHAKWPPPSSLSIQSRAPSTIIKLTKLLPSSRILLPPDCLQRCFIVPHYQAYSYQKQHVSSTQLENA